MKINDILKITCDFLGLAELKGAITSNTFTSDQQVLANKLVAYYNRIQEEIASEYYSFFYKEEIDCNTLYFSTLTKTAINVKSIKNKAKRNLKYTVLTDHIEIDGTPAYIIYSYLPDDLVLGDDVEVSPVPARVYAYGIIREYFLEAGLRNEASLYEDRFKDSLVNILRDRTNASIPCRKWL